MHKKIATTTAKRQPKPESSKLTAKVAAKKMGELMTRKITRTKAMKSSSNSKVKKF